MAAAGVEPLAARASRRRLGAFLVGMGTLHFVAPKAFDRIVPPRLGSPRRWTYLSGVAELTSGGLLLSRRTKRAGGYAAAATMAAVFPANIHMALEAGPPRSLYAAGTWLRLPMQAPMIAWALRQTRAS